jgi:hypothetical protein
LPAKNFERDGGRLKRATILFASLLLAASAWGQTTTLTCTETDSSQSKVNPFELVLDPTAKTVTTRAYFNGKPQVTTRPATFTLISVGWQESGAGVTETDILNPLTGVLTTTVTTGAHFTYLCKATAK